MTTVTLEAELLEGLDRFIADRNEPPRGQMTQEDAINVILRDWLMGQGYIALPGATDAIVPALEAARVPKT